MNSVDNCPCSQWGLIAAAFLPARWRRCGDSVATPIRLPQGALVVEIEPRQPQAPHLKPFDTVRQGLDRGRRCRLCDLTGAILSQAGYHVAMALDSEGAFRQLRRDKPDLVLLDVMMKAPLEGLSILRRMAAERDLKDIPVVMISSIAQTEYASEFPADLELPIEAWLSKPVDRSNPDTVQRILVGRA